MHNKNIKTFIDISRHIKLETEHLRVQHTILVAHIGQQQANKPKHKGQGKDNGKVGNLGSKKEIIKNAKEASKAKIRIRPK